MIAAKAFVYFPKEVSSFLFSNASKEGSTNTCLVKGVIYEMVAPGEMLNATKRNRIIWSSVPLRKDTRGAL